MLYNTYGGKSVGRETNYTHCIVLYPSTCRPTCYHGNSAGKGKQHVRVQHPHMTRASITIARSTCALMFQLGRPCDMQPSFTPSDSTDLVFHRMARSDLDIMHLNNIRTYIVHRFSHESSILNCFTSFGMNHISVQRVSKLNNFMATIIVFINFEMLFHRGLRMNLKS